MVGRDLWSLTSPAFHWEQDCDLWYFRSGMALPSLPLKAFKDRDLTAFLGSMFLRSTTHTQPHASSHNASDTICGLFSLLYHLLLLRRVQLNDLCRSPSGSFRSPLIFFFARLTKPNIFNISPQVIRRRTLTISLALCMPLSCFLMSFLNWGTPNRTHYPSCGLSSTE